IRCVTAATPSCAISSGGRSSVLSGTSTAPIRIAAIATTAQSIPFGISSPTRSPLFTPAATRRAASARLASSSSSQVIRLSSLTRAWVCGSLLRLSSITPGIVSGSPSIGEQRLERGPIELAARQQRDLVVAQQQEAPRHLVGGEPRRELVADRLDLDAA